MQIKNAIGDKSFAALFNSNLVFNKPSEQFNLQDIFGNDWFSITQYLLGKDYYRKRLHGIFSQGHQFLDIGCGMGNWTNAAASLFDHATGIDINQARITIAGKLADPENQSKLTYVAGDIRQLPFVDQSFDALLCFNVVTFIGFPHEELLREVRRVARPGALFYFTAHDKGFLFWLIYQALLNCSLSRLKTALRVAKNNLLFAWTGRGRPTSFFSRGYIEPLIAASGWQVVHTGCEGEFTGKETPAIFKGRFCGFALMNEYILKAV